jgi:hypothetical protein
MRGGRSLQPTARASKEEPSVLVFSDGSLRADKPAEQRRDLRCREFKRASAIAEPAACAAPSKVLLASGAMIDASPPYSGIHVAGR